MGYETEFTGSMAVVPPLNAAEIAFLARFSNTRRMDRAKGPYFVDGSGHAGQGRDPDIRDFNKPFEGQPGLWCRWEASADGSRIAWNGAEKFYDAAEWMAYLIDHFLKPGAVASGPVEEAWVRPVGFAGFTFDHVVNGRIGAEGEEPGDVWRIEVRDNVAYVVCREPLDPEGEWGGPCEHAVWRFEGGASRRLSGEDAAGFDEVEATP
ncbi:hypothetical protein [Phytomonospora endophytica]|uniref:Uncharacterized protein n=1 Tax=Phytomonospora endophytica TaxID=714109 RepID=A0A841FGH6_9ACTN|nr:hypothetical protein [Phytomonospora endophytica]MBB6032948.1 hypothetical protein [Phytomonospora endophytica]